MREEEISPQENRMPLPGLDDDDPGFGLWISIINRSALSYFQFYLRDIKVGPGQQAYLLAIRPDETIKQEELVKRLRVDRANVTRALQSLEKAGHITRQSDPGDKRIKNISLSKKGVQVRSQVREVAKGWIEILKSKVSPDEWDQVQQILGKIARGLE